MTICRIALFVAMATSGPLTLSSEADEPIVPEAQAEGDKCPLQRDFTVPTRDYLEEQAIREKLDELVDVEFQDTSLVDALHLLLDPLGLKFEVDEANIAAEGGTTDFPVALRLKSVPAWQVLELMLRSGQLTWYPEENFIGITHEEQARQNNLITRVYDLEPMLHSVRGDWPPPPPPSPVGAATWMLKWFKEFYPGNIGMGGEYLWFEHIIRQMAWNSRPNTERRVDASYLGGLTNALIGIPNAHWNHKHPDFVGNRIIVRQTHAVHEQIRQILSALDEVLTNEAKEHRAVAQRSIKGGAYAQRVCAALNHRVSLDVTDVSLQEALEQVTALTGAQICLLEQEIVADGGSIDQTVTLNLENVRLETLLRRMLKPCELAVVPEHGVLMVTTDNKSGEREYPVIYDLAGVMTKGNPGPVMDAIYQGTSGVWEEEGISYKMRYVFNKLLVIYQTEQVHREIEELLDALRKSNPMNDK